MKPHFVLTRSKSGRFNFTLITDHGRLKGFVHISINPNQCHEEIKKMAMDKIRLVAEDFFGEFGPPVV